MDIAASTIAPEVKLWAPLKTLRVWFAREREQSEIRATCTHSKVDNLFDGPCPDCGMDLSAEVW